MRVGLISDIHLGYHTANKVSERGVNAREQDFIDAAGSALNSLANAGVDVIADGGDMAHVPAPKKRAIATLIEHVRSVDFLRYLSADGNHTSLKSTSDIHLYDILAQECPNFVGAKEWDVTDEGIALIAHSYDPEVVIRRIDEAMKRDPIMLVGHFAASNVPFDATRVDMEYIPRDIPVWLGHYHKHTEYDDSQPQYIGSTEHTAWDQWDYPTGVTVFDTDTGETEYIQHQTRPFINLEGTPENYMDLMRERDLEDAIVRLTITATPEIWNTLDTRTPKRIAAEAGALIFTQRRAKDKNSTSNRLEAVATEDLASGWKSRLKNSDVAAELREEVEQKGIEALHAG